jgi:hypothetical protein
MLFFAAAEDSYLCSAQLNTSIARPEETIYVMCRDHPDWLRDAAKKSISINLTLEENGTYVHSIDVSNASSSYTLQGNNVSGASVSLLLEGAYSCVANRDDTAGQQVLPCSADACQFVANQSAAYTITCEEKIDIVCSREPNTMTTPLALDPAQDISIRNIRIVQDTLMVFVDDEEGVPLDAASCVLEYGTEQIRFSMELDLGDIRPGRYETRITCSSDTSSATTSYILVV